MRIRSLAAAIWLPLAFALLFVGVGCTSQPESKAGTSAAGEAVGPASLETTPSPLELVDAGFTVSAESPLVFYGFVLRNPNGDAGAVKPTVRITMRDSAGAAIGTEDVVLPRIMPNGKVAWGREDADPHGKVVADVEFEVLDPGEGWRAAGQMQPADYKPLVIEGAKAETNGMTTSFVGEVANPNTAAFEDVTVSFVLKDSAGKLVYVLSGPVGEQPADGNAPANATVPFRVDVLGVPQYEAFDPIVQP